MTNRIPAASGITSIFAMMALLAIAPSQAAAVDVDSETFFADCPGPIFLTEDTTISGKAEISGSCVVSVEPDVALTLFKAKLTFTGDFSVRGDASALRIERSKIEAAGATGIVLDSEDTLDIVKSQLGATAGSMNIPPGGDLTFTKSKFAALVNFTVGGPGGLITLTKTQVEAGGIIYFATSGSSTTGTPTEVHLDNVKLTTLDSISLGGQTRYVATGSQFVANGVGPGAFHLSPGDGGAVGDNSFTKCKFSTPNGGMQFYGDRGYTIDTSKIAAAGDDGIVFGTSSSAPLLLTSSKLSTETGSIEFFGAGPEIVSSVLLVSGADKGIQIGPGSPVTIDGSKLLVKDGNITFNTFASCLITGSKISAFGDEGAAPSGIGIRLSCGTHEITDSSLKALSGLIDFRTSSTTTVTDSKLFTKAAGGFTINQSGTASFTGSKLTAPLGDVVMRVGSSVEITDSQVSSGNTEMVIETTSVGSTVADSKLKANNLTIRSFAPTSVTDSRISTKGTVEFSGDGGCTSTGNTPDIPCL
ncbi:MAG: hypothetical protein ACI8TX_003344 [Hyphomicrobiaceae bacterium]|jgi:hypothetical protein